MRVCQFRHFGNGRIRPASKAEHRNRESLVFQKGLPLSIRRTQLDLLPRISVYMTGKLLITFMEELTKASALAPVDTVSEESIPADIAVEVRKLVHELSNSLEVIVQTSYLLGTLGMKEPASDWLRMMDDGVRRAMDINLSLRDFIKSHTQR